MNSENGLRINWTSASVLLTTEAPATEPVVEAPVVEPPVDGTPPAEGTTAPAEESAKSPDGAPTGAPETYADFTLPEGVTVDAELLGEFLPMAKELGLTQEKAQEMVGLAAKMLQKNMDGMYAAFEARKTDWLTQAQADPEISEDVKKGPQSAALRAFNTLTKDNPAAKQMVDELGIGNHPEFIRVFYRISSLMKEDSFELPGTANVKASAEEILYPTMTKK